MKYPMTRARRLRQSDAIRRLVRETRLHPSNFIYPVFVSEMAADVEPVTAMPGISVLPLKKVAAEAEKAFGLGIPGVLLFGVPSRKDATGSESLKTDGIVQRAIREIKAANSGILVATDVCLCEYTDHGHCGVIKDDVVDNDATIELLAAQAVSHAEAGADMVAPSDMMDGRVRAIRSALDNSGHTLTVIMSYAAKYASAFYGPFREAVGSAPGFGDRKTYQMDPPNASLDIIYRAKQSFDVPIAAYSVSGEYSMIKQAASSGLADEKQLTLEILTAIKRAGADIIITYHALQAARWLNDDSLI